MFVCVRARVGGGLRKYKKTESIKEDHQVSNFYVRV